jgi:hypothetical protein
VRGPTTLFSWDIYISSLDGLCSLSWSFLLVIASFELSKLSPTHLSCLIANSMWDWVIPSAFAWVITSHGTWGSLWLRISCFSWWLLSPRWLWAAEELCKSCDCSWPPPGDCEGFLCLPRQSAKGNSSGLLMSLSYLTCGLVLAVSKCVDEVIATPLSRRTTKCWSTQWGLACRQAREPQEKNLVLILCMIGFLLVIDLHILWLVHPLRGGIITLSPHLHSCKVLGKLFSVTSLESL